MKYTTREELLKLTSKEALQKLRVAIYRPTEDTAVINTENVLLDIIAKDLEMVDILKKVFGYCVIIPRQLEISNDEIRKIKEWLENDG